MKIRRITTAESPKGVVTQVDDVVDTSGVAVSDTINIWGFDRVPALPLRPEHVLGEYKQMGLFGPEGAVRALIMIWPPERGDVPADLSETIGKLDLGTGGGMVPGDQGSGMHRTDTVDLLMVLEGEMNVAYPSEEGGEFEITIKAGDFITHNGTFHRWHNRSNENCVLLALPFAAERKAS